jgi:two-component system chemotaxis response regulator CheY
MRILVADDDHSSRLIADLALRTLGQECHTASDGVEAWEMFQSLRPDVIMSDWLMPGMSGLDLCRKIRSSSTDTYPYLIMVTNRGALEHILEGMNAGVDDYLVKPLNTEDLQARLIGASRVTGLHTQLADQRAELQGLNDELTKIARRDPLTGLGNRRALEEDLELLEARVARYGHRYCMALLDVDLFKSYNDTYGHLAGDGVLEAVAAQLKAEARGGDALFRYGGEEFLCIFPEQSLASGSLAVDRMRAGVMELGIPHAGDPSGVLTISGGIAVLDSGQIRSASTVLQEADEALYRAKQLGRNRVEQAPAGAVIAEVSG